MPNKEFRILHIFDAVLLAAAAAVNLVAVYLGAIRRTFTVYDYLISIALVITSVFAVFYVLAGCKKAEGASFFRCFMNLFALVQLIGLLQHMHMAAAAVILTAVSFGCLTVLSTAKDLGKSKSVLLSAIVFCCAAAQFVASMAQGSFASAWFGVSTLLLLSLTTLLMVCAKYADKAARGRA